MVMPTTRRQQVGANNIAPPLRLITVVQERMMIKELTKSEFRATFAEPMHRMGEDKSYRPIPLMSYLSECIVELSLPTTIDDIEIQHVYLNGTKTFTHVMFFYGKPNVYLIIVVDHGTDSVHGHHILDLNEEYGLRQK